MIDNRQIDPLAAEKRKQHPIAMEMTSRGFVWGDDFMIERHLFVDNDTYLSVFKIRGTRELHKFFPLKSIGKAIEWLERK